jgi:hypothetical protein
MRTIYFVDDGQDFLQWDINEEGEVTACRPFQGWVWVGTKVLNKNIKPGDLLKIERKGIESTLIHPVKKIKEVKACSQITMAS